MRLARARAAGALRRAADRLDPRSEAHHIWPGELLDTTCPATRAALLASRHRVGAS